MKNIIGLSLICCSFCANAGEEVVLSSDQLKEKVVEYNHAFNKIFMHDSTVEDADRLFSFQTEDFVYVHAVYGGTYSREELYDNTISRIKEHKYARKTDRYKIVQMIPGYNGIAVQRELTDNGKRHLTVFEFRGDKISKVVEYWK